MDAETAAADLRRKFPGARVIVYRSRWMDGLGVEVGADRNGVAIHSGCTDWTAAKEALENWLARHD